jgi:hypothetical protein
MGASRFASRDTREEEFAHHANCSSPSRVTRTGWSWQVRVQAPLSQALEKERVQHADRLPVKSDESFLSAS